MNPAHGHTIERGCHLSRQHIRHVKGVGVEEFFISNEIKGYENEEEKLLRHKISRATTVPIYSSALGTFDKAFSASGYSRYFEFSTEDKDKTQSKELQAYLNTDVGGDMSMSQWMQHVWGDKIHYDFNGVMMVELPKIDEEEAKGKTNKPYVIFKSIHDIHDYDVDGMTVEYLILKAECHEEKYTRKHKDNSLQYFRVIDSDRDLIVRVERGTGSDGTKNYENVTILDTDEYPIIDNIWGYVPAIVISDQHDCMSEAKQSFIWQSTGTADNYLLDSSIAEISKKKHGFPQKWCYEIPCKQCDSKGKFPIYGDFKDGERQIVNYRKCNDCSGLGSVPASPSIVLVKPLPDAANPDVGEPFGYVVPDIASLNFQIGEMARLEKAIHESIWSVVDAEQTSFDKEKTATASVLDVSAKQTKLNRFSATGEKVETFLTNAIGKAIYPNNFKTSIVNWGRKYYILTENQLEKMFREAKESGVNSAILKSYMEELIYVRYSTDPVELSRQLKLFDVEPFAHMTVEEVQELKYAAISDKFMKTYFNDYIEEIERKNPTLITLGTIDEIKTALTALNTAKMAEAQGGMAMEGGTGMAIGTSVMVKEGSEHDPSHKGMKFTVAEVKNGSMALKMPDGTIHKWYTEDELIKQ